MRNSMDYIYTADDQKIIIEVEQKSTRHSVIEQGSREVISQDLKAVIIIRPWNCWYG